MATRIMNDLLVLIPSESMTPQQRAFQPTHQGGLPMYRLLREPTSLDEFDFDRKIAIWRENGTLICICQYSYERYCERYIYAGIEQDGKHQGFTIYGSDYKMGEDTAGIDAKIAETATFFWSLKDSGKSDTRLEIDLDDNYRSDFRVAAFTPEQLAHILGANPKRSFAFQTGKWNAEQSVVFATRPYPLHLTLCDSGMCSSPFQFEDKGTAFVNALESRRSPFGSLSLVFMNRSQFPLSRGNLERLLNHDNISFEKLKMDLVDLNDALLPLSTKTRALDYKISSGCVRLGDFDSVDIVASDLDLKICVHDEETDWDVLLISLLIRVAQLGHFEKLGFSLSPWEHHGIIFEFERLVHVVNALVGAIYANPKLTCLDLSDDINLPLDWVPHLQAIFEAVEDHPGIRMIIVRNFVSDDDKLERANHPAYLWLEQLLSRNRNIKVLDPSDKRIDKLYALNRFCNGAVGLIKECPLLRASLMPTALTEGASENYQRTAFLLTNHVDVLWEIIHDLNLVEPVVSQVEATELPASHPRAAKKVRTS